MSRFGFLEGPVRDEHGFLYVSDEIQNKVSRIFPDGRVETLLSIGDPDGSTLDRRGRLVTCAAVLRAIVQIDPDGKYKVLADKYEGKKIQQPKRYRRRAGWRSVFPLPPGPSRCSANIAPPALPHHRR